MVEITAGKQTKEKEGKNLVQSQRLLGQYYMHQHSSYRHLRRRREKKEKKMEEIVVENISNMGKKRVDQVQEAQSPTHDKARRNVMKHIRIKLTKIKHNEKN